MDYIERDMGKLINELKREYACILITGPRQVGKTTLLDHVDNQRGFVTLDDLQGRHLAKTDPELFLQLHPTPLTIAEVQYAPVLFSYLKIAIDKGIAPGSYFLTGSQSFKLMRLAQESLAGRIAILNLGSLSQHEIYGQGDLEPFVVDLERLQHRASKQTTTDLLGVFRRIWEGGMPALVSGKFTNRDVYYSGYLQTYLSRDVKEEIDLKDGMRFLDFLRAAACRVGQELNLHSIALDVEVSDDTAKRWLSMLEKSEVIYFLHPYSNNLLKRVVKAPKLYFFDTGLIAYLTRHSTPDILMNGLLNGAILENYIVSEIRKSYLNLGKEPYLYYYRDKDRKEIDLILEADGLLHPIEIKKSANPTLSMVKNFDVLRKSSVPVGQGAIICLKDRLTALDRDTLVVPVWAL